jgi:UDP-2-acetamido-2,6-beta-L-arabino-hexul-4-ose reductase
MKLGLTGAEGLIGWHTRAYCRTHRPDIELRLATRETFADAAKLKAFTHGLDAIIHCAGVNRGEEQAVEQGNITLSQQLASVLPQQAHVVFANSTHSGRDSAYGRGKQRASEILANAAQGRYTDLILPHVFGEFGKPYYNSVVSTFCHQLSIGESPTIIDDGMLELIHAQNVAAEALRAIDQSLTGNHRITGAPIRVSELLALLTRLHTSYYAQLTIPALGDPLTRALFNTLRSYAYPAKACVPLTLKTDARGALFETVRSLEGGQAFMSTTVPGITRGNHYHTRKLERFLVCSGRAEIRIRKLFSDQINRFTVSGDAPCYIDMPSFHTHSITNIADTPLVTLFWASELFDPNDSDTFSEMVLV